MNPIELSQENFKLDFDIWVTDISLSKGQLHTNFDIIGFDRSVHQTIKLRKAYLNKVGNYSQKISATFKDNMISFLISEATQHQHFSFYQVVGVFEVDTEIVHLPISAMAPKFHKKYFKRRKFFLNSDKTRVVFPTLGYYNFVNFFIDDRSRYDCRRHVWLEYLTTVAFQKKIIKQSKDTILMFEKDLEYAQDNSFSLFQWVQEHIPNNHYYYVMQANARQLERLKPYQKHVVYAGSLKYYWLLIRAKMLVSSDTPNNIYTNHNRKYAGPLVKKVIFRKTNFMLQHGVIAFKKLGTEIDPVLNATSGIIDFFVSSTPMEQKIIHDQLNFPLDKILMLGLVRWDRFKNKEKQLKQNRILYMPTWRQWLFNMSDNEFKADNYFVGLNRLLKDEALLQLLKDNNLELDVYLHPFLQRFTDNFKINSKQIRLLKSEQHDLLNLVEKSLMLITDYSSISWDFAIQRKPILFYQFDRLIYEEKIGSYTDLKNMEIGKSYTSVSKIVEAIDVKIRDNFSNDKDINLETNRILSNYDHEEIAYNTYEHIKSRLYNSN